MTLETMIEQNSGPQFAIRYYHEEGYGHVSEAGEITTCDNLDSVLRSVTELTNKEGWAYKQIVEAFNDEPPEITAISIVLMTTISTNKL